MYRAPFGASLISTSISIKQHLRKRLAKEALDGPLTDYEPSDSEGSTPAAEHQQQASHPSPHPDVALPAVSPSKVYDSWRKARLRRFRRAADDSDPGSKRVVKKRRIEAAEEALLLPFSMLVDVEVTKPGWLGKRNTCIPKQMHTKGGLTLMHGMVCFPWDGRCASTSLFFDCSTIAA